MIFPLLLVVDHSTKGKILELPLCHLSLNIYIDIIEIAN